MVEVLTFLIVYGVIYLGERNRGPIEPFTVGAAVLVPILACWLVTVVTGTLGLETIGVLLSAATLVILMVISLWKIGGFPIGRATMYAAVGIAAFYLSTYLVYTALSQ